MILVTKGPLQQGGIMADQHPRTKVAAVHAASVFLDRDASLAKACDLIEAAAAAGARLIAFPEAFIAGYPFWVWTHTPRGGVPFFTDLYNNAVEVPSSSTEVLADAARRVGAYVVMGVNERAGGTLYNTLLYFDDQGALIGRHRKLQPTHAERMIWGRGDSSDVFVLDTRHGRLGGLICWEHTMDLARYALTTMGEQIHVAAWPAVSAITHDPASGIFDSISEAAAKHHALAGQTFVINVQSRVDEDTVSMLGLSGRPDMIRVGGGWTAIVGPDGQIVAGPHRDDEAIVYADIDLADIIPVKRACDSAGHYARPDVFSFGVRPAPAAATSAEGVPQRGPTSPESTPEALLTDE